MELTKDDVRAIARLARLELDDEELALQAKHLNDLLAQFDVIDSLDLDGVEPTSHSVAMDAAMRDDMVTPSLERDDVLRNAPESRDGRFVVPQIIES